MDSSAERAFSRHEAYSEDGDGDGGFVLDTTAFEGRVVVEGDVEDGAAVRYRLVVRAPTLEAAVEESVGPALREGWFETFELRLEDAPGAVRDAVEFEDLTVTAVDGEAVVEMSFRLGPARAPDVAKALAEYVEGTYMEGIVPGYSYRPPVSEMLARARQGEDGDRGPMPL
jgi:hypothetical protein